MDINIYVSLYKAPSIYSLPRWNLGFFPLSNACFITSLSFFFFSRSSQIRSSVIQTPSLMSRFFRMTLYLSGRYTNLHIIARGLESLLGPARWAFSRFGSKLSWFARMYVCMYVHVIEWIGKRKRKNATSIRFSSELQNLRPSCSMPADQSYKFQVISVNRCPPLGLFYHSDKPALVYSGIQFN